MPGDIGLDQLTILKVRVRFRAALRIIDSALANVAQKLGVSSDDLAEMSVPAYG